MQACGAGTVATSSELLTQACGAGAVATSSELLTQAYLLNIYTPTKSSKIEVNVE